MSSGLIQTVNIAMAEPAPGAGVRAYVVDSPCRPRNRVLFMALGHLSLSTDQIGACFSLLGFLDHRVSVCSAVHGGSSTEVGI